MANLSKEIVEKIVADLDVVREENKGWVKYLSPDGDKRVYVKKNKTDVLSELHVSGFEIDNEHAVPPKGKLGKVRQIIRPKKVTDAVAALEAIEQAFGALADEGVKGDCLVSGAKEREAGAPKAAPTLDYEAVAALRASELEAEMGKSGSFVVSDEEQDREEHCEYIDGLLENDEDGPLTEDEADVWGDSQVRPQA